MIDIQKELKVESQSNAPEPIKPRKAVGRDLFLLLVLLLVGDLFIVKAASGFWDMVQAVENMAQQCFPEGWETGLTLINLCLELLAGMLLVAGILFPVFRLPGLSIIVSLLAGYTAYSELALIHALSGHTCECINWLPGMSWGLSLTINGVLLLCCTAALLLVIHERKERRTSSRH